MNHEKAPGDRDPDADAAPDTTAAETDGVPSAEENPPADPRLEETPDGSSPGSSAALSPAVLILGFLVLVLLSVLVFNALFSGPAADTSGSPAIESLEADIETRRADLNRQRIALGMEPLDGGSGMESAEEIAERLKSDASTLAALADSFQDLLDRKDARLDEARAESVAALKDQRRLREMLDATREELNRGMIDASLVSSLRADLETSERRNDALARQLREIEDLPETLRAELREVKRERDSLAARVGELEDELRRARLFAGSESELFQEGVKLFRALRDLQGASPEELARAYSRFGADLGANVLQTCRFETASAEITPGLEEQLRDLPSEAPEGALLLAVGYASETGDFHSNRALSSDRARAVVGLLNTVKRPNQRVQAVYLGPTSRFGEETPEENQRVEVWRVVPAAAN